MTVVRSWPVVLAATGNEVAVAVTRAVQGFGWVLVSNANGDTRIRVKPPRWMMSLSTAIDVRIVDHQNGTASAELTTVSQQPIQGDVFQFYLRYLDGLATAITEEVLPARVSPTSPPRARRDPTLVVWSAMMVTLALALVGAFLVWRSDNFGWALLFLPVIGLAAAASIFKPKPSRAPGTPLVE